MGRNLWVIRPEPNFTNRLKNFLEKGMVAIGWPGTGDLGGGLKREKLSERLTQTYDHYREAKKNELAIAAGILNRFVNDIKTGDYVLVPNGTDIYIAEITGNYVFHPELSEDNPNSGYPHWRPVRYLKSGQSICQVTDLPLSVRRGIDCRLSVFAIHSGSPAMWEFIQDLEK